MFNCKVITVLTTAGLISFGAFSGSVLAANGAGTASATIATALQVNQTVPMNFGDISPDADQATTVDLDTSNGVTSTDGAGIVGTIASTSGTFSVTGSGNLAFTTTLPADTTVTLTGPGTAMAVDGFIDSLGGDGATSTQGSGTLSSGSATFTVGATLTVGANQTTGTYNGAYTVVVEYQ